LSAHPNVIMFDTTCKTNVKNKHFGWGSGRTMKGLGFRAENFFLLNYCNVQRNRA
jgi:hypothetical protein